MQSPNSIDTQIVELTDEARRMVRASGVEPSAGVRLVNRLLDCATKTEATNKHTDAIELRKLAGRIEKRLRTEAE